MAGTLSSSIMPIEAILPKYLTSMTIAYYNSLNTNITCESVFEAAVDSEMAASICAANDYDFTNINTVSQFVDGPWYYNDATVSQAIME